MISVNPLRFVHESQMTRRRVLHKRNRVVQQWPGKRGNPLLSAALSAAIGVVLGLCLAAPVQAQTSNLCQAAETPAQLAACLVIQPNLPMPPVEPPMGLCPELIGDLNAGQIQPGSAREDLLVRCREMVLNANQDFEVDDSRDALQNAASEEVASQGTNIIETSNTQFSNIGTRLAALRGGATGVSLRRFALQIERQRVPVILVASADSQVPSASREPTKTSALFKRLGIFANGTLSFGDKDATNRESGFDFDTIGVTGGVDYRFSNNFILGLAFGYMSTDVDLDDDGGGVDTDGYSVLTYATYYIGRFFLDGIVSFGWNDYDIDRTIRYSIRELNPDGTETGNRVNVDQTAKGDSDGTWYGFSFGVGYDFNAGGLTFGPLARVNYLKADIDGYEEKINNTDPGFGLALDVSSQDIVSLTSVLGAEALYAISVPWGVLQPQVRFEWEHEFENDSRTIKAFFVEDPTPDEETQIRIRTDSPDRDFFNIGAGLSLTFRGGLSAFFYYETVLDLDDVTVHNFAFGLRAEL